MFYLTVGWDLAFTAARDRFQTAENMKGGGGGIFRAARGGLESPASQPIWPDHSIRASNALVKCTLMVMVLQCCWEIALFTAMAHPF